MEELGYNLIKTPRVETLLTELEGTYSRLHMALGSAIKTAWKSPQTYPSVMGSDPPLRRIRLVPMLGVPPLDVFFHMDNTTIYLTIASTYEP